jgi:hypothetical protein
MTAHSLLTFRFLASAGSKLCSRAHFDGIERSVASDTGAGYIENAKGWHKLEILAKYW